MNKNHRRAVYLLPVLLAVICIPVFAHSGRTDGAGGHTNSSTGTYHYHHGYDDHQHYDMNGDGIEDCPYKFKNATTQKDSNSSNSKKSLSEKKQTKSETKGIALALVILAPLAIYCLIPIIMVIYDDVHGLINKLKKRK